MVAFYPHFVSCSGQATLHDVVGRWFFHGALSGRTINL